MTPGILGKSGRRAARTDRWGCGEFTALLSARRLSACHCCYGVSGYGFVYFCLFILDCLFVCAGDAGNGFCGSRTCSPWTEKDTWPRAPERAALSTEVTELLYGFRDLKVYGQLNKWERQLAYLRRIGSGTASGDPAFAARAIDACFVTYLISWGVLILGAYLIMDGSLAGVFLAMLVMASLTVFEERANGHTACL